MSELRERSEHRLFDHPTLLASVNEGLPIRAGSQGNRANQDRKGIRKMTTYHTQEVDD